MSRPLLEVADIFRSRGPAWRRANRGHISLDQLKVMSAIERCRTAARHVGNMQSMMRPCCALREWRMWAHAYRLQQLPQSTLPIVHRAWNTTCQGKTARDWLEKREAELLPVGYFHVVFTLPAAIADIAFQNKRVIYDILFKASAETMLTIAADPRHLGAKIAITSVLHTWGSAMTHHPHVHMIVPGGGISPDGLRWISCRKNFFLPVRVLSRLFRRLFIEMLVAAHDAGQLNFFGKHAALVNRPAFDEFVKPFRKSEWVVVV